MGKGKRSGNRKHKTTNNSWNNVFTDENKFFSSFSNIQQNAPSSSEESSLSIAESDNNIIDVTNSGVNINLNSDVPISNLEKELWQRLRSKGEKNVYDGCDSGDSYSSGDDLNEAVYHRLSSSNFSIQNQDELRDSILISDQSSNDIDFDSRKQGRVGDQNTAIRSRDYFDRTNDDRSAKFANNHNESNEIDNNQDKSKNAENANGKNRSSRKKKIKNREYNYLIMKMIKL
ncbi:hypothetical protein EDEG_02926 [Edhazardia aedis USNM 41457]|uniref:Uncharacterized protein n=1 Tax=Edhazardia aedis (strain USNM 41457) TaxID=1003232 RepID=J9D589_EDHAE|nr:hypothetical protein EDEG_02926 [Edhazardia aedis USNM 41457]|eukprot:EJW02694.1 hypothetical protein EDEG_02926 [Edhazardia aedis USNM 41457]